MFTTAFVSAADAANVAAVDIIITAASIAVKVLFIFPFVFLVVLVVFVIVDSSL